IDIDGDGTSDNVSGIVGSTYIANGDRFILKVQDESAKFNLNDSPGIQVPERNWRIVKKLSANLFNDPAKAILIADNIFETRSELQGRFTSMAQVRRGLEDAKLLTPGDWQLLASNLTIHSWADPNTIRPNPQFKNRPLNMDDNNFDYNLGPWSTMDSKLAKYGDDIYTVDQIQCLGFELESRSPVHINLASVALLAALFEGIQGYYIYEYGHTGCLGKMRFFRRYDSFCDDGIYDILNMLTWQDAETPLTLWLTGNYRPILYSSEQFKKTSLDPFTMGQGGYTYDLAGGGLGALKRTVTVNNELALDLAAEIYARIHNDDKPFRIWQEFQEFIYDYFHCYDLKVRRPSEEGDVFSPPFLSNFARRYVADAILANFNPNSDLNDYNPNRTLFKYVDKADLLNDPCDPADPSDDKIGYTTEFCLEPSGVFSIQSLGIIQHEQSSVRASAELSTAIELFTPYRHTSQAQFLGKESSQILNDTDDLDQLFVPNKSAIPTAFAGAGILALNGDLNGYTVQSYPEALAVNESGDIDFDRLNTANFDGYLMPATLQDTAVDGGMTESFRASFNGSLDADFGLAATEHYTEEQEDIDALYAGCDSKSAVLIAEQSSNDRLMIPVASQGFDEDNKPLKRPGTLYADGAYSEAHRTLIYHSGPHFEGDEPRHPNNQPILDDSLANMGNFGSNWGQKGALTMWVKPNWNPARTAKGHIFFDVSNLSKWSFGYRLKTGPPEVIRTNPPAWDQTLWGESSTASYDLGKFRFFMHPAVNNIDRAGDYLGGDQPNNEYMSFFPYQSMVFGLWAFMGDSTGTYDSYTGPLTTCKGIHWAAHSLASETANHDHK
ncbi:hypothetical protein ACFL54_09845, partial [Planctomycetota bacterium]